jgi:SAM-dependent methyltransferase
MDQSAASRIDERSLSKVILRDERVIAPDALSGSGACMISMEELAPFLASPDSGLGLAVDGSREYLLDANGARYPIRDGLPVLIPTRLQRFYTDHLHVPSDAVTDAFFQYYFLSAVKQSGAVGAINAPATDAHYQRHLFRMKDCLNTAHGLILDVGCDDPEIGAGLLPSGSRYVGLDPFCQRAEPFRVVGFGEQLPFADSSFDGVIFNTSLDHILDWRRAVGEAQRVLVPGGQLFISTLVWTSSADLVTDSVHFHHFRDYEILGGLQDGWEIEREIRYSYKGNIHRHGLYLSARKPALVGR